MPLITSQAKGKPGRYCWRLVKLWLLDVLVPVLWRSPFGDMAISNVAQFGLLLWKNWLLQKRRVVMTTLQIIIPVLCALLLLVIRLLVESNFEPLPTIFDSFDASTSLPSNLSLPSRDVSYGVSNTSSFNLTVPSNSSGLLTLPSNYAVSNNTISSNTGMLSPDCCISQINF